MPKFLISLLYLLRRNVKIKKNNNFCFNGILPKSNKIRIKGKNNTLECGDGFSLKKCRISIDGNNNQIEIGEQFTGDNFQISVTGNNNRIVIGKNITIYDNLCIHNNGNGNNCLLVVGDKTTFFNTDIHLYDSNSSIEIGQDCMFSYNTTIYHSDGHAILENGKVINKAEKLQIGNHVWVGWDATILKNSFVADGCIIGRNALVSGKHNGTNTILVGIPAKPIKYNIHWDRKTVNEILDY